MAEGLDGDERRWLTEKMERPLGRGVNAQSDATEIDERYKRVPKAAPENIYLQMETKQYQCSNVLAEKSSLLCKILVTSFLGFA